MPRVAHGARRRAFDRSRAVFLAVRAAQRFQRPPKNDHIELYLGLVYILAGIFFVVGSVFFLPGFEMFYRTGVWLYFYGGLIYLKTSLFDLEEAFLAGSEFEVVMNKMYVAGTVAYLFATLLYAPLVSAGLEMSELWGSTGFIIGSLFFVFACFLNGAHTGDAFRGDGSDRRTAKIIVLATTNFTMFGAVLFLVGSVLYLPIIGCSAITIVVGTFCYLLGSLCFTVAGILSLVRKSFYAHFEHDSSSSGGLLLLRSSHPRINPSEEEGDKQGKTSSLPLQQLQQPNEDHVALVGTPYGAA